MNISIILDSNPWIQNTASANRWLTLINGLSRQRVQIKSDFIICQDGKERQTIIR